MRDTFLRAEPYLDLESYREDPSEQRRKQNQSNMSQLKPEALRLVADFDKNRILSRKST